jgi:general stress protein 26
MTIDELVEFVRARGLAVVASVDPSGRPEAALIGVAATDRGEIVFDTSNHSRKVVNVEHHPLVALVIGWDDEVTLQCEGTADFPTGEDLARCQAVYFEQYPDGRARADWPDIRYVRVQPTWLRLSDYRPGGQGVTESEVRPEARP